MFSIQLLSDIHLETWKDTAALHAEAIVSPACKYLALCGDIGNPTTPHFDTFLSYCSSNFTSVFYVLGNHEYYNNTYKAPIQSMIERTESIRHICSKYSNIHVLDRGIFDIPDTRYTVVGATLWSNVADHDTFARLNDGNMIYTSHTSRLSFEDYNALHMRDREYLMRIIDDKRDRRLIILTHHLPLFDIIIDKYRPYTDINQCFATDCRELFAPNIEAWLCGHTHGCNRVVYNNIKFVTNTRGYRGENVSGFSARCIISIPHESSYADIGHDNAPTEDIEFV